MISDKTTLAASWSLPKRLTWHPFARLFEQLHVGHLRLRIGQTVHELHGEQPGLSAEIAIHHPLNFARHIATRGHVGLGEAYLAGDWDSPDLSVLIQLLASNQRVLGKLHSGTWHQRLGVWLKHRLRPNSRRGSRRNIAAHYDLGNDFYALWLDPSMTYSAAIFADPAESLEQAQQTKYHHLLALLDPAPGSHLLEIGCGWGGFARYAAAAGHRVTGVTLSREQLAWAVQQQAISRDADRMEFRLQDYRDIRDQFDHIVSIEMFEAVGETYWPIYMQTLKQRLRPGGRAALQVIVIDERDFADYQSNPDFIQRYIFPGGMLPTVERFDQAAQAAGLTVGARHCYGLDYAHTLALWQRRFVENSEAVRGLGYDERFIRMWRYYLAYCEAGFREQRVNVMQVILHA